MKLNANQICVYKRASIICQSFPSSAATAKKQLSVFETWSEEDKLAFIRSAITLAHLADKILNEVSVSVSVVESP